MAGEAPFLCTRQNQRKPAAKDADDDANFLKGNTERVELGSLKGNEGDQNYEIPSGTDLSKFQTVSIYCERFNANFGAAPLEKF